MATRKSVSKSWALAIGAVTLLALTSCAGRAGDAAPQVTESSAVASSQPSETSTTKAVTFSTDLCTSLLDSTTVASFKEQGFIVSDSKFLDSVREDAVGHETTYPARFLDSGGMVCRWGEEGGDQSVIFAYGALAAGQGDAERSNIKEQGSKSVDSASYERYTEPYGYEGGYAFGDGYWAYVLDNGAKDVLDEIVRNAPAF